MKGYWYQKASVWVSAAVLVGGLVSASLLAFVYKAEKNLEAETSYYETKLFLELDKRSD